MRCNLCGKSPKGDGEYCSFCDALLPIRNEEEEKRLLLLREQGVTDEDVRFWKGLSKVEKERTELSQHASNMAMAEMFTKEGLSPEEAMRKIYKTMPQYDNYPQEESFVREWRSLGYTEEDDFLPWELHKRCTAFIFQHFENGNESWFKEEARKFNTINAFFRKYIRLGVI